jgi:hypothetical protein
MSQAEASTRNKIASALVATREAINFALQRRDGRAVFALVTAAYLAVYLRAIGHLEPGLGATGLFVVADPLAKFFEPALGPLSFTPVAVVQLGPVTYLFSLNTVIGVGIAALVGINLAVTYLAWRQPSACGIARSSSGLLASIPAILSGTACCGPVLLIVIGVQASGLLLTTFQYLLPAAVLLLLASLVVVARRVDPPRFGAGTTSGVPGTA